MTSRVSRNLVFSGVGLTIKTTFQSQAQQMRLVFGPVHGTTPRPAKSQSPHQPDWHKLITRPLSSTAASIILNPDGSIHMVLGGSGGSRIFPSLAQVLLNLQCGLNLSEAVERPRVHDQIVPNVTTLEVGPEGVTGEWKELVDGLKARGHQVGLFDINIAISEGEYL
jgi:gamma-glutamyltranspeptidase